MRISFVPKIERGEILYFFSVAIQTNHIPFYPNVLSWMDHWIHEDIKYGPIIVPNTPASQVRLLYGSECKFLLRQVRPNLFCQVIRNLHKAVCGLQSLIFMRRHQKSLQLWWMMQTGILIFWSWKKPPITGKMCCYVGILLLKLRSVLLTFDIAVQA